MAPKAKAKVKAKAKAKAKVKAKAKAKAAEPTRKRKAVEEVEEEEEDEVEEEEPESQEVEAEAEPPSRRLVSKRFGPVTLASTGDAEPATEGAEKAASDLSDASPVKKPPRPRGPAAPQVLAPAPVELHELLGMIGDSMAMKRHVAEFGADMAKLPLGKFPVNTVRNGFTWLKALEGELLKESPSEGILKSLSSFFYRAVPHCMTPMEVQQNPINTKEKLDEKLKLVESLADVEAAQRMLKMPLSPEGEVVTMTVDQQYAKMRCELKLVAPDSEAWALVEAYAKNTDLPSELRLVRILEVERQGEERRFEKHLKMPNRTLLWHGAMQHSFQSILSAANGFKKPPKEAPDSAYPFGKGVYFSDTLGPALANCVSIKATRPTVRRVLLLLSEVALGRSHMLLQADCHADKLPAGCNSVQACGSTPPDVAEDRVLPDGVRVPLGKPTQAPAEYDAAKSTMESNQFVVYDLSQIRMRYLVEADYLFQ
eukprot:gnl/TRDRNA2_/TRDRNA2_82691_c0_seq1.p1 gnl/TRDRNA2_/TRDRNA2_82691_c0~~gnl/TRDRNA2_/TRDRNA2_82691_c0_seq1.p1  ORF type:complete len:483 (+),score=122.05 gnl/TRDRNA2_/TRDRNA2_82691_c0_seq1:93-1541(+)